VKKSQRYGWERKKMVKHECSNCKRGKLRIANILRARSEFQNVTTDDELKIEKGRKKGKLIPKYPNQQISEFLPPKDYYPDISAERDKLENVLPSIPPQLVTHPIIIEVDHIQKGSSSHKSKNSTIKDRRRDKHFLSKGIPTIRFNLKNIIGVNQWQASDIIDMIEKEIEHQLK
jgi:hypothetical protein